MLKIQGIFTKCMSSREPSFCPTEDILSHSVTSLPISYYQLFFNYQFFIDSYYQHLLFYVLPPKSFCVLSHTGYLHSFCGSKEQHCSDKNIQVLWMDGTLLSVSFCHCSGSLASCLTSLLPCSASLQHLHPSDRKVLEQELRQALVPAVAQLPEQDRRRQQARN